MRRLFSTVKSIFTIKEIRKRLLVTCVGLFVFRLGNFIVLPGINPAQATDKVTGLLALLDNLVMLGSSFQSRSIFALGISPYISASIFVQFASINIPYFQRLQREGAAGRSKLSYLTRLICLVIAPIQAIPYAISNTVQGKASLLAKAPFVMLSVLLLTAGTISCIWIADRITDRGVGNGTSVLIMGSILSSLPAAVWLEIRRCGSTKMLFFLVELIIFFVIVMLVITFMQGTRKIPLQYARQVMTPGARGGARQYLPIKLNAPGVMPIIVANQFNAIPLFIANMLRSKSDVAAKIATVLEDTNGWYFNIILATLIFVMTFVYNALFINPTERADDLKRSNGFIPGIKPGNPTAQYIDDIINKITLPSSLFLVCITLMPPIAYKIGVHKDFSRFFGGTSSLILIGVILEIINQIEGYRAMRYYDTMTKSYQ